MYPNYNSEARNFLLQFMHKYFPDLENLLTPHHPLDYTSNHEENLQQISGLEFKEAYKILNSYVRERNEFIPPLISIYMNLSPSMKTFGTAVNKDFGNVEETGILVTIDDIFEEKKETVSGIIGKTHGVNNAKKPPIRPNKRILSRLEKLSSLTKEMLFTINSSFPKSFIKSLLTEL